MKPPEPYMSSHKINRTEPPAELHDARNLPVIFVHSSLDDAGLSPEAFRVYCHIARRAGERGAFPSVRSIGECCGMSRRPVMRSLRELIDRHMVSKQSRPGETSVYRLTHHGSWRPGTEKAPGAELVLGGGAELVPGPGADLVPQRISNKVIQEGDPNICAVLPSADDSEALKIYRLYPRKIGKPAALRAIGRALKTTDADSITDGLARWIAYWTASQTVECWIPHPATWINQRRWEDAPPAAPAAAGLNGRMQVAGMTADQISKF